MGTIRDDGDLDLNNRVVWWPFTYLSFNKTLPGRCNSATGKCNAASGYPDVGEPNYQIVDTDLTTYSIVYSCEEWLGGALYHEYVWFLSREPHISISLYNELV